MKGMMMSSNRLYIKCRACNEKILLAKAYGFFDWEIWDGDCVNAFMSDHTQCGVPTPFELEFETPPAAAPTSTPPQS